MQNSHRLLFSGLLLGGICLSLYAQADSIQDTVSIDAEIRKWEADIRVLDSLNLAEEIPEGSLLFTGSSSIRLWDSLAWDMAPYQTVKRAYGGAKLSDFSHYLPRIVKANEYRAIVIFVANDISGRESDLTPEQVYDLFREVTERLKLSNPDSEVFWIEVTPTPSRWAVFPLIREAGDLIEVHCENNEGMYFIDTSPYFMDSNNLPDSSCFVNDMLHLNRKGYFLWTGIIKQALAEAGIYPLP